MLKWPQDRDIYIVLFQKMILPIFYVGRNKQISHALPDERRTFVFTSILETLRPSVNIKMGATLPIDVI